MVNVIPLLWLLNDGISVGSPVISGWNRPYEDDAYLSIYLPIYPSMHPSIYAPIQSNANSIQSNEIVNLSISIYLHLLLSISFYLQFLSIPNFLFTSYPSLSILSASIHFYFSVSISIVAYLLLSISISIYLSVYIISISFYVYEICLYASMKKHTLSPLMSHTHTHTEESISFGALRFETCHPCWELCLGPLGRGWGQSTAVSLGQDWEWDDVFQWPLVMVGW